MPHEFAFLHCAKLANMYLMWMAFQRYLGCDITAFDPKINVLLTCSKKYPYCLEIEHYFSYVSQAR